MYVWQIPKETKKKAIQKSKTEEAKKSGKGHSMAGTSKNPKNIIGDQDTLTSKVAVRKR